MEAIFLPCGAGGPQLKRNPLGGTTTMLHRSMPHSAQLSRFSPELLWFGSLAWYPPCLEVAPGATAPDDESEKVPPNPRLKLSACGRRLRRNAQGKPSILAAASASRSLSASR